MPKWGFWSAVGPRCRLSLEYNFGPVPPPLLPQGSAQIGEVGSRGRELAGWCPENLNSTQPRPPLPPPPHHPSCSSQGYQECLPVSEAGGEGFELGFGRITPRTSPWRRRCTAQWRTTGSRILSLLPPLTGGGLQNKGGYSGSGHVHFQAHFNSFWCEMM